MPLPLDYKMSLEFLQWDWDYVCSALSPSFSTTGHYSTKLRKKSGLPIENFTTHNCAFNLHKSSELNLSLKTKSLSYSFIVFCSVCLFGCTFQYSINTHTTLFWQGRKNLEHPIFNNNINFNNPYVIIVVLKNAYQKCYCPIWTFLLFAALLYLFAITSRPCQNSESFLWKASNVWPHLFYAICIHLQNRVERIFFPFNYFLIYHMTYIRFTI